MTARPTFGDPADIERANKVYEIYELADMASCPASLLDAYHAAGAAIEDATSLGDPRWSSMDASEAAIRAWGRAQGYQVSPQGLRDEVAS